MRQYRGIAVGKVSVEQALAKAKSHSKKGEVAEARSIYISILEAFPKNKKALESLSALGGDQRSAVGQGPPQAAIDQIIDLYNQGQLETVFFQAKSLIAQFPRAVVLWNILGITSAQIGKLEQAFIAFKKVIAINPNDPKSYNNIGNVLKDQGRLEEAVKAYSKAISLKTDYAEAYLNMGNALNNQIKLVEALKAYNKAISLKPNYSQAYLNMGNVLFDQGKLEEAVEAYNKVLSLKPDYAEAFYNMGNALSGQGKLEEAIESYNKALAIKPDYAKACFNMGNALQEQGKSEAAIEAYAKALAIKPDYADAYNNRGVTLHEQGKLKEAIESYAKALSIKPDYADAYNNRGITLKEQGKLEEAIEAYNKALTIKPDYAEAYINMGVVLADQGKLEEAIEAYNNALAIKPDYAEAMENSQSLAVQLLPIITNYGYDFDTSEAQVNSEIVLRPKYQIQNAIKAYLAGDFGQAYSHNNNFKACDQNLLVRLKPKDKVFCSAYNSFIGKLLDANWDEELACENKVYHLGESHCLSYAHRNIAIGGSNFRIVPRITFGAKAFHFCRTKYDRFKAITKAHLMSLPKNSKVFLSYGEIDCRPNEGFISAARKLDKPLEELIDQTTEGYVQWFLDQNADQRQRLYFINVPAPVYYKEHSADLNSEVARTVALFNTALKKYSLQHGFDVVDVFNFTVGKEGFSNGLFHIDNHHLGAQALVEINRQLS